MAKSISPEQLAAAIQQELTTYHAEARDRINEAGSVAIKKLVKMTKATAPVGHRGSFRRSITSVETTSHATGMKTYTWGAKAPDHRLTHLLVHGHATKDGGRARGSSFMVDAMDVVLPEYEQSVKEALRK